MSAILQIGVIAGAVWVFTRATDEHKAVQAANPKRAVNIRREPIHVERAINALHEDHRHHTPDLDAIAHNEHARHQRRARNHQGYRRSLGAILDQLF